MKFQILHENRGRMRIGLMGKKMALRDADAMEAFLRELPGVQKAAVHERTGCAIILYQCPRADLIDAIARFHFSDVTADLSMQVRSREMTREYTEKLVMKITRRYLRKLFVPVFLRRIYTAARSLPYLWRGLRCLLRGSLRVELLDALSIGISLLRGDFATASSVRFLLEIGDLLDEWTHKKTVDDLARTMSLNIDKVWVKTDADTEVLLPLSQIRQGDRIVVRIGGVIPIDGVIESGQLMVNQASLTGESIPVPKFPGMTLYAGTVAEEGECVLRVRQQPGESRYDKIITMIEESERLKSSVEHRAFYLADKLVPYTLLGSGLTYLLSQNVTRAVSVLMVDFSCALKLAMPLAVLSAMREAGDRHITVKGGKFLETVANADTIVFDKTGTLTHACPKVVRVIPFGGNDEREMLRIAACLEEHFPHSMANAVVQAARERNLQHEELHTQVEYIVAHGIRSSIDVKEALIGSAHFVFEDEGVKIPRGEKRAFNALPDAYSHLYLALGGKLAAVICIADPLRAEARSVMEQLHSLGFRHLVMLTGDSERTAAAVAREIADITITSDDLKELVVLRRLAAGLMERIRRNYHFVMSFNGGLIALGSLGILPPATSALLHNGSTIAISLQSMTNLL